MPRVETVKIAHGEDDFRVINMTDFDPDTMTLYGPEAAADVISLKDRRPDASKQAGGEGGGDGSGVGAGENGSGSGAGSGAPSGSSGGGGAPPSLESLDRDQLLERAKAAGMNVGIMARWKDDTVRAKVAKAEAENAE